MGKWYGSKRQFTLFVNKLNELAKHYGIQFGHYQIGREVSFLDVKLYLDDDNKIHYKLHRKETDARLYLKPTSYHPQHVFSSVIFSQIIRVIERNSKNVTCVEDISEMKVNLMNSGHNKKQINELESKAYTRVSENKADNSNVMGTKVTDNSTLVYSVKYFEDIDKLKNVVFGLDNDIKQLCGNVKIIVAMRKHSSISNLVIKNRKLSNGSEPEYDRSSQKCNSGRCYTCPLLFEDSEIMINGKKCKLDMRLNCKSKNVIYVAKCKLCDDYNDTYFGKTVTAGHIRMNGHRSKFKLEENEYEKSALSIHCFENHPHEFDLKYFNIGFVKSVTPNLIDKEEDMIIQEYRTNILGLNRILVRR